MCGARSQRSVRHQRFRSTRAALHEPTLATTTIRIRNAALRRSETPRSCSALRAPPDALASARKARACPHVHIVECSDQSTYRCARNDCVANDDERASPLHPTHRPQISKCDMRLKRFALHMHRAHVTRCVDRHVANFLQRRMQTRTTMLARYASSTHRLAHARARFIGARPCRHGACVIHAPPIRRDTIHPSTRRCAPARISARRYRIASRFLNERTT